jgi:type I restriction enzyme, R subunit
MGQKKRTTRIFGPYIDVYRLADAERDKAVVPIYYAGRTVKGAVRDGRDMDEVFEDMLADHTPAEMEEIKKRYATKGDVMEAEELIAAKAKNMLRHYVETVLPNGFKAQVAAHSRVAAVRYRAAFLKARDELVARNPKKLPPDVIDQVKRLDFIPVISPAENDPKAWETWTDLDNQRKAIGDFKNPAKPPAFLIVKSMLLTGFDAPVEQVLYLDRSMKEAELLQAIARVNRPAAGIGNAPKQCGYVIDYVGVTQHLTKALKAYADEDIEGVLTNLETDQVGNLRAQRARVRAVFTDHGVTPGPSAEAKENCVLLLADGAIRDRFETELNGFLATVDTVLPLPRAREFLPDAQLFAEIAARARRRYRENGDFDPSLYGEKVRELIDEHMTSLGVDQVLPPVSITDPEYQARAAKLGPRARASEMEHAIRHHISLHMDEDPTRYRRLSERLEQILEEHRDNWEQQAFALSEFLDKFNGDFPGTSHDGSPVTSRLESALYGLLAEETAADGVIGQEQAGRLAGFSGKLNSLAIMRTKKRDFWRHPADQADFTKEITVALITDNVCQAEQAPALADKLTEIIRANKAFLQSHD